MSIGLVPGRAGSPDKWGRAIAQMDEYYAPAHVLYLFAPQPLTRNLVTEFYISHDQYFFWGESDEGRVVLVIDSLGGDVHAAYTLARIMRNHCSHLTVVVPRWAKSAATLLCLAADETVLSAIAELGPLDPLVRRPGETTHRAVLDEYSALAAVHDDALTILDVTFPFLIGRTGMDLRELLSVVPSFVAQLLAPVYARIDPHVHGSNMRMLSISKAYARKVLMEWGGMSESQALRIADQITMGYPCHDYVIDVCELHRLGLRAREATREEELVLRPFILMSQEVTIVGRPHTRVTPTTEDEELVAVAAEDEVRDATEPRVSNDSRGSGPKQHDDTRTNDNETGGCDLA